MTTAELQEAGLRVSEEDVRGMRCAVVRDADDRVTAVIAHQGATLVRWCAETDDGMLDLVDGYTDVVELRSQPGVRNGVLAPFSNRIATGVFDVEGTVHDLRWMADARSGLVYHGLLRLLDLTLESVTGAGDEIRLVFATSAVGPDSTPGYPAELDLEVVYEFGPSSLSIDVRATNRGQVPAPYGAGWHPYFTFGTGLVDELELTIPARTLVRTDDDLMPLPGDEAFQPVAEHPELDFRTSRRIGDAGLDVCFADLDVSPDGLVRSIIRHPGSGHELELWQERGHVHLFTAHTLPRDRRRSLALEPVEFITNAFNRPELDDAVTLAVGASRSFAFGVRFTAGQG